MIHSQETTERIRELLSIAGVPKGDALEEMIDHYLSDIERQLALSINTQVAIRSTFQKIGETDLRDLQQKKKPNLLLVLATVFLLSVSFYIYQNYFYSEYVDPIEIKAENKLETEPEGWPLNKSITVISSNFGLRKHPILNTDIHHNGIDIKAKIGTPVLATGAAVVIKTGYNKNAGKFVILKHNDRYSTQYYHLSSIDVQQCEMVIKGSIIGKVGNSGMSTSPHLHYEIMDGGTCIDPLECTRV